MLDIAIVGIGCRFLGSIHDTQELWEFLLGKGDGMVEVPSDRWDIGRFYDPDPDVPGRMYTPRGGFLTDSLWDFDAEYFGISPREASIMDPQQRLILEVAVEALDDAGMAGRVAGRSVGVYIGGFMTDNQVGRHMIGGPLGHQQSHRYEWNHDHVVEPPFLRARPGRSEHDHRHRLLFFFGGHP
jgi:acyl transferase domain-containing protein